MCGIGGKIVLPGSTVSIESNTIKYFLKERGPDNYNEVLNSNVFLCHSRLKILDLNDSANQPMAYGNTSITYNGEIYNYLELQGTLIQAGYKFNTQSDTEVVLKGYDFWGEKVLDMIEGMYAFAIYDDQQKTIFLARDLMGKKPLYFCSNSEEFIFSSDIRVVKELSSRDFTIDWDTVNYYLIELSSPQPRTIWKEVKQMDSGGYILLDTNNLMFDQITCENDSYEINNSLDAFEIEKRSEELLTNAILKRTISDVPLGTFLSGGVDSGLITAILAQNSTSRIKTFTAGFDYEPLNEIPKARKVAQKYNTDHTEVVIKPNVVDALPKLIDFIGEPFADSSLLPTYYISKEIKKSVTVALSGDGGDELFGGYNEYHQAYKAEKFKEKWGKSKLKNEVILLDKFLSRFRKNKENKGSYNQYLTHTPQKLLSRGMGFKPEEIHRLLNKDIEFNPSNFPEAHADEIWRNVQTESLSHHLMIASLNTRLLNDYLVKLDRASMINSLEIRSPFLDKHLVKFAFSIPVDAHFDQGRSKAALRNIASKYLGDEYLHDKKAGFGMPIYRWLQDDLNKWMNEILESLRGRTEFFNSSYIEELVKLNRQEDTLKLWSLICLELWMKENI